MIAAGRVLVLIAVAVVLAVGRSGYLSVTTEPVGGHGVAPLRSR